MYKSQINQYFLIIYFLFLFLDHIDALNKDADQLDELYVFNLDEDDHAQGLNEDEYFLVNTSGRVVDNKGKSRDGSDYYFVTGKQGQILAVYLED